MIKGDMMDENDLTIKIVEDYVIIKRDDDKNVLDESDLKEMIMEHFKLREELDTINVELNQLGKLVKGCV